MKRILPILLILALAFSFAGCGNTVQPDADDKQPEVASPGGEGGPSDTDSSDENQKVPLTEEEQKLIGVWEADDGSIVAVRERGNRQSDDYPFDIIHLEPISGEWLKVTREDTTFETGGTYIVSDLYMCPDPSSPEGGMLVETEERLEYDPVNDVLLHISRHPTNTGEVMEWENTLVRTDRSPTDPEIDWSWYYDIHPDRK